MKKESRRANHLRAAICQISYLLCVRRAKDLCVAADGAPAAVEVPVDGRRLFRAFRARRLYPKAMQACNSDERKINK